MSFQVAHAGSPSAASCAVADMSSTPFTTAVGDWRDGYIAYGLVSTKGTGAGPDDRATCVYRHYWKVTGGGRTTPWSNNPTNGMRFDSSTSLGKQLLRPGSGL